MRFWQVYSVNMQDRLMIEKIPFRGLTRSKQSTGSYCGPAVLQILLSHYGVEMDQEWIVDGASCRNTIMDRGMSVELLAKAIKNTVPGMSFWMKMNSEISDLDMLLGEYKFPVAVNWQGEFETVDYEIGDEPLGSSETLEVDSDTEDKLKGDQGHYSVLTDINLMGGYVRVADPYGHYAGKDRFFAVEDFSARWWDDRYDYLPNGEKKYIYVNRLMFTLLPSNLRWPAELGMVEV